MSMITEIVVMKTNNSTGSNDFLKAVEGLEKNFHSKQKGFLDSELLFNEENKEWSLILHWKTSDDLKVASEKIFNDSSAKDFVHALDTQSIKKFVFSHIKKW